MPSKKTASSAKTASAPAKTASEHPKLAEWSRNPAVVAQAGITCGMPAETQHARIIAAGEALGL